MRKTGDLQGVVHADYEVGGLLGGGILGKGKDPRKNEGEFYVPTLEVEGVHHAGGARTVTAV